MATIMGVRKGLVPHAPGPATSSSKKRVPSPRLDTLVEEILGEIAIKLGSDDLFALRLTCRSVEAKVLHEFGKEYFAEKCFMFTSESLNTLVHVANSAKMQGYLTHVYLTTARPCDRQLSCCNGDRCSWKSKATVRQREALTLYIQDQQQLRKARRDKELLTAAFSRLPKLTKLTLVDQLSTQLPQGVECHGLAKFTRTTKSSPSFLPLDESMDADYFRWLSHVFRTMIIAVASSGITSIESMATSFHRDDVWGLSPLTDLKFKESTLQKLAKALTNLRALKLTMRDRSLDPNHSSSNPVGAVTALTTFMKVGKIRPLEELQLCFDNGNRTANMCMAVTDHVDLPKLARLFLSGVTIDIRSLAFVVRKLQSLTHLTLHGMELTDGSWAVILKALEKLPALVHLHLQFLQLSGQRVYFLKQPDPSAVPSDPYHYDPLVEDVSGEGEEWSDEADRSDCEMPDLIPQDGKAETTDHSQPMNYEDAPEPRTWTDFPGLEKEVERGEAPTVSAASSKKNDCASYTGKNYQAPGHEHSLERGYYICVRGEEIRKQLPAFIKELNVADGPPEEPMDVATAIFGLGDADLLPPPLAAMYQATAVDVGMPIPFAMPPPLPPSAAPGTQSHPNPSQANAAQVVNPSSAAAAPTLVVGENNEVSTPSAAVTSMHDSGQATESDDWMMEDDEVYEDFGGVD